MFYIVDTHALIWFLTSSPRLSKKVFKILNDSKSLIIISTLVLAEIKFLSEKARIEKSFSEIVEILQNDSRVKIHPIDLSVVENAPKSLDIHDSLICGTALVYQKFLQEEVRLITKDKEIINAKVIETLW